MNGPKPFGKGGMLANPRMDFLHGCPGNPILRHAPPVDFQPISPFQRTAKSPPSTTGHPAGPRAKTTPGCSQLRENADALMVGRGTLEADRMTMTVPGKSTQPLRCIVSRTGAIPPDHPLFHKAGGPIHLLVTG